MIIKNCFDSHLHWQGIGSFKCRLNLSKLNSLHEIKNLKLKKENYRANWLMGHGWTKSLFSELKVSPKLFLDNIFPHTPIYFTSHDIHCVWLNSKAIKVLGLENPDWINNHNEYIETLNGELTGLFYDLAKDSIDKMMPLYSDKQVRSHLLIAQEEILQAGITHIRDLTCSREQLTEALALEKNNQLYLVADLFFKLGSFADLDRHIQNIKEYKKLETNQLKVKGVKIFLDGALGSGGALLTTSYLDKSNGFKLFTDVELEEIIIKCFESNLEISFHTIGDQSSLDVCNILLKLKNRGVSGKVHLEHVQILTDDCVKLISELSIVCHMQPQHWASDKTWLAKKIPQPLLKNVFRWADLEDEKVELYFGSDAPVENLSVGNLLKSLNESSGEGIASIKKNVVNYIAYPDKSPIESETYLTSSLVVDKVVVNGKVVFTQCD